MWLTPPLSSGTQHGDSEPSTWVFDGHRLRCVGFQVEPVILSGITLELLAGLNPRSNVVV